MPWGEPIEDKPQATGSWGTPIDEDATLPAAAAPTSGVSEGRWGTPVGEESPNAGPPMPGFFSAVGQGVLRSGQELKQSAATVTGSTVAPEAAEANPAAAPYEMRDIYDPARGLAKTGYRLGQSAPVLAGGILGGAAGAAVSGPGAPAGALVGGAAGAAATAAFQAIGPVFGEELRKSPNDPEGAWTRAMEHAAVSGIFSGLGWAAFPLKFAQGPLKNLAFQAFGVQPAVGMTEQATQNVVSGKPATEGLGQAYVESAVGTAVPAIGHKVLEGAKAPVAPQRLPVQDQLLQSAQHKQGIADQLRSLADNVTNTDDAFRLKTQADEIAKDAAKERFLGNMSSPIAKQEGIFGKLKQTWVDNFQPELTSDKSILADARVAQYKSSKAQAEDSLMVRADEHRYDWNKVPENDVRTFLEYYETPDHQLTPDLRNRYADLVSRFPHVAQDLPILRKWLFESYMKENELGSRAEFVMNYFPHLFEGPQERVQSLFQNAMSQQGLGPTWFQNARYYQLIEHALQNGLKLRSNNPIDLVTMRLFSGVDMMEKQKLLGDLREQGLAIPKEEAPPYIMSPMKSQSLPWQEIGAPNGKRWMLAPDVQALWQNGVEAKGLWANQGAIGDAFRGWMALKNAWVPIKLGISMFHPIHVFHINMSSNITRALHDTFGRDQQSMWTRVKALPEAAWNTLIDPILAYPIGIPGTNIKLPASSHIGKEIREAWQTHPDEQTPRQQALTQMMNEAGVSAQLSEQLRNSATRDFKDAIQKGQYLKAIWPAVRTLPGMLTKPFFEHWIPNLKAAAVMRETESLWNRRPDIMADPNKRAIAMRAIGKQIDNRFGEMFYGSLFWNRTVKDASIGSFLSLGWNLGFSREFVGGALEPSVRRFMEAPTPNRQIIRDVTTKATNTFVYAMSAFVINAMMNKAFTGEYPQDIWDFIFPRIGGLNPDGSPRRITNPFYTREIPMVAKHIEEQQSFKAGLAETLKNKLMFAPFIEMVTNHNYFGNQIWDDNAPYWKQWQQYGSYILNEQMNPMSIAGAKRSLQLSGKPFGFMDVLKQAADRDVVMPVLGFGPAPSYASKDAIQNRIGYLYRQYVAPSEKPFVEAEKMKKMADARTEYKQAQQSKDPEKINAAAQKLAELGMKSAQIKKIQPGMEIRNMFQMLGSKAPSQQIDLLKRMSPEQFRFYYPAANKTRVKSDPDIRELAQKYYR